MEPRRAARGYAIALGFAAVQLYGSPSWLTFLSVIAFMALAEYESRLQPALEVS